MPDKQFILGVGCQKGGTTWLHSQLAAHPEVNMGFAKEYHVFDALYLPGGQSWIDSRVKSLQKLIKTKQLITGGANKNLLQIIDFYRDTNNYYNYFECLYRKSGDTRLVGDITPAYNGLPAYVFEKIKKQLNQRGFTVKVIFLMRDPLERVWSSVRMTRRDHLSRNPGSLPLKSENEAVLSRYNSRQVEFRTRYENTIENIESVFSPEDIYYGFYETMFTETSFRAITNFLGISATVADFDKHLNKSPKSNGNLDVQAAKTIARYYKATYQLCDQRFSTGDIWGGYQYL